MRSFTVLWFGQAVSILGSGMTWFAFTIWVWEKTGKASSLAFVSFFTFLPSLIFTPFVGPLVDRWNRKLTLLLSDMASALVTLIVLILFFNNFLEIWHVYLLGLVTGIFMAFQFPAFTTITTIMLSKNDYARAEGMMGLARAFSGILAPITGAFFLAKIGMQGIMILDLLTFVIAFATLAWIQLPAPASLEPDSSTPSSFFSEISFGFSYIFFNTSLRALLMLFMVTYFFLAIGATLMAPMILELTGSNESWANIQASGAVGGIVGGIVLSLWGGPRKRILGILLGGVGASILGVIGLGVARTVFIWAGASFFFAFFEPFIEGGNLAIWQSKVEVAVQGRVMSVQRFVSQIPYLIGIAASGWLADLGLFADVFGNKYSFVFIAAGVCAAIAYALGFFVPSLTNVEQLMSDNNNSLTDG